MELCCRIVGRPQSNAALCVSTSIDWRLNCHNKKRAQPEFKQPNHCERITATLICTSILSSFPTPTDGAHRQHNGKPYLRDLSAGKHPQASSVACDTVHVTSSRRARANRNDWHSHHLRLNRVLRVTTLIASIARTEKFTAQPALSTR
jgi:hypothetical protein